MEKFHATEAVVGGTSNTNEVRDQKLLINEKTGRVLSKKEIRALAKEKAKAVRERPIAGTAHQLSVRCSHNPMLRN